MAIQNPDGKASRRAGDRILAAARDLFYRSGIRAVGVEEIVTRAGATKPSLYRSFGSKNDLTTRYLEQYDARFWSIFEEAERAHPDDPYAQILFFMAGLAERAATPGYRGCGLTNALVEYPEADHPARAIPVRNKRELRRRLSEKARDMGAADPDMLGDGLHLLIEGAYVSVHLFGTDGPARALVENAKRLIQAGLAR